MSRSRAKRVMLGGLRRGKQGSGARRRGIGRIFTELSQGLFC
jgi:hypothetical protein